MSAFQERSGSQAVLHLLWGQLHAQMCTQDLPSLLCCWAALRPRSEPRVPPVRRQCGRGRRPRHAPDTRCAQRLPAPSAAGTECCQHPLLPRPRLPRRHLRCVRNGAACRAGGTGTAPGRCPAGAGAGRTRWVRPLHRPLAGGAGAVPERGRERGSPAAPGTPRPPAQTGTELWKNKVELGACGLRIALHSQGR